MRSNIINRPGLLTITAVRILLLFFILLFSACSGGSGGSDTSPSDNTNNPPQVNAGEDQAISLPTDTIQLNATATDDSLPAGSTLTYAWIQESGPENVTFSETDILQTAVTFVNTGSYVFQLTVSDGELSTSDTVTITVNEEGSEPDPSVEISRAVSRTSGVAPLSVHFTAGFNSSTTLEHSFHDYDYLWSFDDAESGNWGNTGKSKNNAKGPVATHIFETPGNYAVTLTIRDVSGIIDTDTFNITVTNPDTVFSGLNTTCVSTGSDFTGAPSGSRHVTTSDLSTVTEFAGPGKRLLLRRGDSWNAEGLTFPYGSGECIIGAFGSGTGQDELGIYDNAPLITVNSGSFLNLSGKQDWRIMDLFITDPTRINPAIIGTSNVQRILLSRLKIEDCEYGFMQTHYNTSEPLTIDQIVLNECDISGSEKNVVYMGGERIALLGNKIGYAHESHVLRIWQGYKGVISNNLIYGSSMSSTLGRQGLKLHSPHLFGSPPASGTNELENKSEFIVISDNTFGGSGPWPITLGPQNTVTNEEVWDVIFERNRIISEYMESSRPVSSALNVWGRFYSIRNNIFDLSNSGDDCKVINIDHHGIEAPPLCINVYNNTIYKSFDNTTGYQRWGIIIGSDVRQSKVFNNLVSFPGATVLAFGALNDSSPDLESGNNLFTDTPQFADPDNADPLDRDFNILFGSPVIDEGIELPVFDDFSGADRPSSSYDIGAFEY